MSDEPEMQFAPKFIVLFKIKAKKDPVAIFVVDIDEDSAKSSARQLCEQTNLWEAEIVSCTKVSNMISVPRNVLFENAKVEVS